MSPLTLLCAAALCLGSQDPVRVSASLSADQVPVGGSVTLSITVETRRQAPELIRVPALSRDLEVVGTSDFTETRIAVPGGRTRVTRREVVLIARTPGAYRIPSALVQVAGRTYRTDALMLLVTRGGALPGDGLLDGSATTLELELRPDTVYVGQQVLLRARVTFAEPSRMRQSRPPVFDPPAPRGFWIQDVPDPIRVALRVRDGRTVETQTYRRAYFPLTPGEFTFPPAGLRYEVRRGVLYSAESREVRSDSARLVVRPVPDDGRPAAFTGAVGSLAMRASVAPDRIPAGAAGTLTLELEGRGNVRALPPPRLPELEDVEFFPPAQEARVDVTDDQVGGLKRFRWTVVPRRPGALVIPPIEYAVFDPELERFVVLRTDTLRLTAVAAAAQAPADTSLRGLRPAPARPRLLWTGTPLFAAAQGIPLLALVGLLAWRRRRALPPGPRQEARRARQRLGRLRSRSDDPDFPGVLEREVRDAIARIAGVPPADPGPALRAQGRAGVAAAAETLLAELRRLRYAPSAEYDAGELLDRADALIHLLVPRGRFRRRSAVLVVAVAGAALSGFAGTPGTQAVRDATDARAADADEAGADAAGADGFAEGVRLYGEGDFAAAEVRFRSHAHSHPHDVNAWYNAGLAAYRAGDRGRGVWAWLRTVRHAPRDADARHNLRAAGAGDALARVLPPDRLSSAERTLLAAAAWWLLLAGIAAAVLRRRRVRWIAAPALALLLALAVSGELLLGRPVRVTPLGDGATLRPAPTTREEPLGTLRAGALADLEGHRNGWLLVRTEDGSAGWVERAAVASP